MRGGEREKDVRDLSFFSRSKDSNSLLESRWKVVGDVKPNAECLLCCRVNSNEAFRDVQRYKTVGCTKVARARECLDARVET